MTDTPTDAAQTALHAADMCGMDHPRSWHDEEAQRFIAALPPGTAIVTVDTLAAAMESAMELEVDPQRWAAAIIEALRDE